MGRRTTPSASLEHGDKPGEVSRPSYFPRINGVSAEGLWGGIRG